MIQSLTYGTLTNFFVPFKFMMDDGSSYVRKSLCTYVRTYVRKLMISCQVFGWTDAQSKSPSNRSQYNINFPKLNLRTYVCTGIHSLSSGAKRDQIIFIFVLFQCYFSKCSCFLPVQYLYLMMCIVFFLDDLTLPLASLAE